MNYYKEAIQTLQIDSEIINETIIKKQFRLLALKYHPDKNNHPNANAEFTKIKSAYDFLMDYKGYDNIHDEEFCNEEKFTDNDENISYSNNYVNLLYSFINIITSDDNNYIIKTILNKISTMCQDKALDYLKDLDKQTLIKVYELLIKYKESFHYDIKFINDIRDIVIDKSNNDERIILNPSLDDLINQKLYKLTHDNNTFYVPLWQNEVIYNISNKYLYVSCVPEIPNNMKIDDYNNIHVHLKYTISEIWGKEQIDFDVCSLKLSVKVDRLKIKSEQTVVFSNIGIPMLKSSNLYDVSRLGDVILQINITNS
jgi:DnaJ-class molecular chaperone